MKPPNYKDEFEDALEQAFAARDPAVRSAYFDLARFYRDKLEEQVHLRRAAEVLGSLASRRHCATS